MTSTSTFLASPLCGAALIITVSLGGCSTVGDISPFSSSIPYANAIKPTLPQPAVTDIPAFTPVPKPEVAKSAPAKPSPPPPPAPAVAPQSDAPPAAKPEPVPPQAAIRQPAAPAIATAVPPVERAVPPVPAPATAEPAAPAEVARADQARPEPQPRALPSIPDDRREFTKDDGQYPNLAQVPARPVNLPTFAEAAQLEQNLRREGGTARNTRDESPNPAHVVAAGRASPQASSEPVAIQPRLEDRSPCVGDNSGGSPTAVVRFSSGSAALRAEDLAALVQALPSVRSSSGPIRLYGHGDGEGAGSQGAARFDLAVARAGAVAQALAGYGISAARMAVGVACTDTALVGSSVQLFAQS